MEKILITQQRFMVYKFLALVTPFAFGIVISVMLAYFGYHYKGFWAGLSIIFCIIITITIIGFILGESDYSKIIKRFLKHRYEMLLE